MASTGGGTWTPLTIVSWGIFALMATLYYLFYLISACRHRIVMWSRLCCRRHPRARAVQSKYEKQLSLSIMLSSGGAWIAKMMTTKNSETHSAQGIRNTLMSCTVLAGFAFNSALSSVQKINNDSSTDGNGLTPQQASDLAVACFLFLSFLHFLVVLRSGAHLTFLLGAITGQDDLCNSGGGATAPKAPATIAVPTVATVPSAAESAALGVSKKNDDAAVPLKAASADVEAAGGAGTGAGAGAGLQMSNLAPLAPVHVPAVASPNTTAAAVAVVAAHADLKERVGRKLGATEAVELAVICERMIRQLSVHFSLAFRSFFWSLPVAFFAAGPIPFIVASCAVTFFLLYMDTGGFGM